MTSTTMRLEKLLPPARPGKPWRACLEGGEVLHIPEGTVADHALYQGMELGEETLTALKAAASTALLRERAVGWLSHRPLSAGELKGRLQAKGATPEQAEEITAWVQAIGLLNELDYAKALVGHYQAKGYGLYKIKDELYRRKVPREHWEEALGEMEAPDDAIDRFLAKRVTDPTDRKQLKKASDALARRGFSWSQVAEGIERLREGTDWRD